MDVTPVDPVPPELVSTSTLTSTCPDSSSQSASTDSTDQLLLIIDGPAAPENRRILFKDAVAIARTNWRRVTVGPIKNVKVSLIVVLVDKLVGIIPVMTNNRFAPSGPLTTASICCRFTMLVILIGMSSLLYYKVGVLYVKPMNLVKEW